MNVVLNYATKKVAEKGDILWQDVIMTVFNCIFDDCIKSEYTISSKERRELKERDNRYFNAPVKSMSVVVQKPTRAKHRHRKM